MPYYFVETRDLNGNPAVGGGMLKRRLPRQNTMNYIGISGYTVPKGDMNNLCISQNEVTRDENIQIGLSGIWLVIY